MKKLIIPLLCSWPLLANADLVHVHFTAKAPPHLQIPAMENVNLQVIDGELIGSLMIDTALAPPNPVYRASVGMQYYSSSGDDRWVSGFVDQSIESLTKTLDNVTIWDGAADGRGDWFKVRDYAQTKPHGRISTISLEIEVHAKEGVDFIQGTELTQNFSIDRDVMADGHYAGFGTSGGSVVKIKSYQQYGGLSYSREPETYDVEVKLKTLTVETIAGDSLPEVASCPL